jgi:hypothetical protein
VISVVPSALFSTRTFSIVSPLFGFVLSGSIKPLQPAGILPRRALFAYY